MTAPGKAPAGWYPAKDRDGEQRYWDGAAWTTAYRPAPAPAPAAPAVARPAVDNSLAWLLVFVPLLSLVVEASLLAVHVHVDDNLVLIATIAVTIGIAAADARLLRNRGVDISGGSAAILVPIYLFQRAKRTMQSYAIPVTWLAVFAIYIGAALLVTDRYGEVQLDMGAIESGISQQVDASASTSSTTACPSDDTYYPGDTFQCTVSDSTGELVEEVSVHAHGDVTWAPVSG